jgi:NHLM bacteriocin system ABC transporter peptidase/ATP-binding protein
MIVFWQFNHFVVVEGFGRDGVYLNDPAHGHRTASWGDFELGFTGVVLKFEPGPNFQPAGRPSGVNAALWRRLRGNKSALLLITAAGLLSILPGLAIPAMAGIYLDAIILEGRMDWFRPLILAMIATVVLKLILQGVQQSYMRRLRMGLMARLNSQFFWHLLRLPVKFYTQRFAGEIVNRMELNSKLANVVAGPLTATIIDLLTMVVYGTVLLFVHAPLTLIAIAFSGINLAYLRYVARRRIEANIRFSQAAGKLEVYTLSGIQSIETMKASGMENEFFGKWTGYFAKSSNAGQDLQYTSQLAQTIPFLVDTLTTVLILIIGGYSVIHGEMSIGMLVAFQGLMGTFLAPMARLTELGTTFQELRGDLMRLDDVLASTLVDPSQSVDAVKTPAAEPMKVRLGGELELKGITFGYSLLEPPLIEAFNLKIAMGQRVALVGGSGSGKSTLARLISGLYQPWAGEILFDGQPRTAWPVDVINLSLGMVEQQIMLFEGTVRENLTLWDQSVSDALLERACRDAHVEEVILNLPGDFSGKIAEGGANLSGGQCQRLEIARTLVNNPAILVLDEATSSLDAETEAIIDANIRRRGCTCVIIAHRLSTIRDCDEILVLDGGRVVERGTHDELWRAGGQYAALLKQNDTPELERS